MTLDLPDEQPIQPALRRNWPVEERHLYNPAGPDGDRRHAVLSSPSMIWEMETTCTELAVTALSDLGENQTTVGFHVDVKHLAPAKLRAIITTTAVLTAVDGKKLTFSVEAREGDRLLGIGWHRRAVIDLTNLD